MEIDVGPNPNCSELVASLNKIDTIEDLREFVPKLESATKWKLGVMRKEDNISYLRDTSDNTENVKWELMTAEKDLSNGYHAAYPIEDYDKLKITDDRNIKVKITKEPFRTVFNKSFWYNEEKNYFPVGLITLEDYEPKVVEHIRGSLPKMLKMRFNDGYCSDNKHLKLQAFQDYYESHYRPMAQAIDNLNGDYHTHDGGSDSGFVEWCNRNGFEHLVK